MEKIFKRLWILWMFVIIISFFTMNEAKAEHEHSAEDPPIYQTPGLLKKPVPVYCGPTEFMLKSATKTFNQVPLVAGQVITSTGEVVAMITVFIHQDGLTDMSVLMTMLDKNETCVLGYGKDLKFYEGEPT